MLQDAPLSVICVLGALCTSSLLVLALAGIRVSRRCPPLEPLAKPIPEVYWASACFAGLLVINALAGLLATPDAGGTLERDAIVRDLWFRGLVFLALLIPIGYQDGVETADFGFHLDHWRRQLSDGLLGFLAAIGPVIGLWALTSSLRTDENKHRLFQLLDQDASLPALGLVILAAVVAAPLLEELLYRVVLQTWLEKRVGQREALVIVAVLFAAVHRLPDAVPLLPLALVLGYVYQQRRSFLSIVMIHVLFNGTNLALALLSRGTSV